MLKKRLIPCLILKNDRIVQSFNFKRYLPIGNAKTAIEFVTNWDVDEIFLVDITATREKKKPNLDLISSISENCFIPLTIGGGIHEINDIKNVMRAGADKISINSEAVNNPEFITESSEIFGSQCIVVSIDVLINTQGKYEVFINSGRIPTGLDPVGWAKKAQKLGAGEIFLNSIDRDGSRLGYDLKLLKIVTQAVDIPIIACGGVGIMEHLAQGIIEGGVSAVSAGNIFHHMEHSTIIAKAYLKNKGIDVRLNTDANYEGFIFDEITRINKKDESELGKIWFRKHTVEKI